MESPLRTEAQVIDLSAYNGIVDFDKMVSQGVTEVILRATWRLSGLDAWFVENHKLAINAGLEVGAYHVWDSSYSHEEQSDWFLWNVQQMGIVTAALDVEEPSRRDAEDMDNMHSWLWDVSCALGKNTMIYTSIGLWNNWHNGGFVPWAWNFPLWIADYDSISEPIIPFDWHDYHMWQYSGNGNGMGNYYGTQSASVDLNKLNR